MSSRYPHFRALPALVAVALFLAASPGLTRAAEDSHVVQDGETLSKIAVDLGVDPDTLARANGLDDPNRLSIGQLLKLPPSRPRSYQVQAGDTLSDIAGQYGVTVAALVAANQLAQPDQLAVGTLLALPPAAVAPTPTPATPLATAPPAATAPPRADRTIKVPYLVKPGDTLAGIARNFETTPDALSTANGLANPDLLVVGQTIQVPAKTRDHQVVEGETLDGIAARYTVDLGSLVDFNRLSDPNLIRVGDLLVIPQVASVARAEPTPAPLIAASVLPQSPPPTPVAPPPTSPPAPVATPAAPPPAAQPTPAPAATAKPPQSAPGATSTLAAAALRLVGRPYAWGGSSEAGFDCSGLVWYVAKQAGANISRGLLGQFNAGAHPDRKALQPGDIIFFQNTYMPGLSHNGIYVGDGKFVHAADERSGVTTSRLDDPYWTTRYFGATRVG